MATDPPNYYTYGSFSTLSLFVDSVFTVLANLRTRLPSHAFDSVCYYGDFPSLKWSDHCSRLSRPRWRIDSRYCYWPVLCSFPSREAFISSVHRAGMDLGSTELLGCRRLPHFRCFSQSRHVWTRMPYAGSWSGGSWSGLVRMTASGWRSGDEAAATSPPNALIVTKCQPTGSDECSVHSLRSVQG